jgi:hypothetical protein
MNKWIVSACFLALTLAPAAAGDVRLDSYRHPEKEIHRLYNQTYLEGAKGGLMMFNAWAKRHGGPAFCMPPDRVLTVEQAEDIMLKAADKRAAKGDIPISALLLWGMQDTFPCEKPGGEKAGSEKNDSQ